jgi:hypothetical protein
LKGISVSVNDRFVLVVHHSHGCVVGRAHFCDRRWSVWVGALPEKVCDEHRSLRMTFGQEDHFGCRIACVLAGLGKLSSNEVVSIVELKTAKSDGCVMTAGRKSPFGFCTRRLMSHLRANWFMTICRYFLKLLQVAWGRFCSSRDTGHDTVRCPERCPCPTPEAGATAPFRAPEDEMLAILNRDAQHLAWTSADQNPPRGAF